MNGYLCVSPWIILFYYRHKRCVRQRDALSRPHYELKTENTKFLYKARPAVKLQNKTSQCRYKVLLIKHVSKKLPMKLDGRMKTELENMIKDKRVEYQKWLSTKDNDDYDWKIYKRLPYKIKNTKKGRNQRRDVI